MGFKKKMDDSHVNDVNLSKTNLQEVLKYCKPKEVVVLTKKFGLLGDEEMPLQAIGDQYGLTRERIRQIENQGLMRFRRLILGNEKYIKVIEEAKKILHNNGGLLAESEMISKLLNKGLGFTGQELKLILSSDFDIYYIKRSKNLDKCFFLEPIFEDLLNDMAVFATQYLSTHGSTDEKEFTKIMATAFQDHDIVFLTTDLFYENTFHVIKGISVFDGKVGLDTNQDVNPKTIKDKLHFILKKLNKPLHFQELASKVIEWFPKKGVKVNTVHNELVKNSDIFVNMGLGIYGLKEWGYQGGTVKEIIERVLHNSLRPLTIKEITKEVLKEKMVSPNTVNLTLQKHDCFERVNKGTYKMK